VSGRVDALVGGRVDVWAVDLDAPGAAAESLSADERARAARFARAQDGRRWAAARGVLRALLAVYAGAEPAALRFALGPHGKPALACAGDGGPDVRFNLSHSGEVALIAFALGRELGVDVELPRRPLGDVAALAARVLGAQEAERLRALEARERERAFLRAWTRHEALVKCRGVGIGGDAGERPDAAGAVAARGRPAATAESEPDPWVVELALDRPGAAALAVVGGPCELRRLRWA
jgi:4'-phosphopantetheinyl transferase